MIVKKWTRRQGPGENSEKRDGGLIWGPGGGGDADSSSPIQLYLSSGTREPIAIMNGRIRLATITFATALAAAVCMPSPAQAAKLYKWVDDEGNVTYSERKPVNRESETIRLRGATLDSSGAQEKLDQLNDRADAQRKDREFAGNSATATAERNERLASNCKIAQENMRILRTTSRIQDKDADGEAYFLDEAGIQAKMSATQRQIDNNCN